MGCNSLTTSINPSCEALNKAGGVKRDIYFGAIGDIDAAGVSYDANGGIEDITLTAGKNLIKVTGKIEKNSASDVLTPEGEGNVVEYEHSVTVVIYHSTQTERVAIEDINKLDQAFAIVPKRNGQIDVYGIAASDQDYRDFGLKASAGEDQSGVMLNDLSAHTLTLTGRLLNKPLIFGEGETLEDNLTTIEGKLPS